MSVDHKLNSLLPTCQFIAQKGLCPATGGNFSVRIDHSKMWISASSKDKSHLNATDFLISDLSANKISGFGKPSAEAFLHGMIYQLSALTECVLHTHSVNSTVLSLIMPSKNAIIFQDYEMQKTIAGCHSHLTPLQLMIFDNDQDITYLANTVKKSWSQVSPAHGLLVRGHGLYSWGNSVFEAKRHMEGLEFLIECQLLRSKLSHEY